jgi:hypothetical protein
MKIRQMAQLGSRFPRHFDAEALISFHYERHQPRHEPDGRMQHANGLRQQSLNLVASMLAAQTPFAKVFAVVTQQPVAALPYPGPRPANNLTTSEAIGRIKSHP